MPFEDHVNIALRGLSTGAVYGLVGMGFNVTYATTHVFNFAHGEFVMVGAMLGVYFWVSSGWPMLLALAAAVVLAALLGMAEERFAVRPSERFGHASFGWFLSTLGASIILTSAFGLAMGADPRIFPELLSETPKVVGDVLIVPQQIGLIVLAVAVAIGLTVFYDRTLTGRAMGAIAQNRDGAALRGIPVARMSLLAFGLSVVLAALTGFAVAPLTTAYSTMGTLFLFKGFIAAAVGGIPDIRGALVGGLALGLIEGFGSYYIGAGYRETTTFVVLLLVLAVKPNGLFGDRTLTLYGLMERLTSVGGGRSGWAPHAFLLVALLLVPSIVPNRFELFNAELLGVYLIGAIGLNVVLMTGVLSIGHSALFLLGGYTVAILTVTYDWPYWPALAVAAVLSGVVGLLLSVPALRLGTFTLALVTYGYARVAEGLALEWRGLTGGFSGLAGVRYPAPFDTLERYYWLVAIGVVAMYALGHNLVRSPFGRSARAVALQPVAAEAIGVEPFRLRVMAFAMSSAIAGVAGALYVPLLGFIAPDAFGPDLAILLLLMVVLGGLGTVAGPVIGAIVLFRLPIEVERVTDQPGEWSLLAYGVILLLSVHFVPRGLMGGWFAIRERLTAVWRRRSGAPVVAERRRADLADVLPGAGVAGETLLEVSGARRNLGGVQALDGVDLRVEAGQVHALIGPNGSGKTTFLNCVSGFVALDDGAERFVGADVGGRRAARRARLGLGRTFQTPLVFGELSCLENVLVAIDMHRRRPLVAYALRLPAREREERDAVMRARRLLTAVGLEHRADHQAADLPPGQLRLLEIARVVALRPRLVLLDEPAAGLSGEEITELEEIIRALRASGLGVVLVEHHADMVMRVSDAITVIDGGKMIAHGAPDQVRRDPAVVRAYLGSSLDDVIADHVVATSAASEVP